MASGRAVPGASALSSPNLGRAAERVVTFYNQRGTAEQWIKADKARSSGHGLSWRTFAANA
jgi:hypothetical protein